MTRRNLDAYYTPEHAVYHLFKHISLPKNTTIYEPCVGMGGIALPLKKKFDNVMTNDVDPSIRSDLYLDATQDLAWVMRPDWTITNPPFNQAFQIVSRAVKFSKEGVAMLLRLSFLEPTLQRGMWLSQNPPDKLIVLPRISFTGDGKTDSVTCAWMIWINKNPKYGAIKVEPKLGNKA